MRTRHTTRFHILLLTVFMLLLLCGCQEQAESKPSTKAHTASSSKDKTEKGSRSNMSKVLTPSADGTEVYSCEVATMDVSNSSKGYVMISYTGSNSKVKLQITGPDAITYTYNLHGDYEVFPLTAGSGSYEIGVYENVSGTQYSTALSQTIQVSISDEFGPYLYPSQYVNFNKDTGLVKKGETLAYTADSDIEVIESVYNYVIEHISYDYNKAKTVESGYLPDVDSIDASGKGICFDYAAVMATLLRTQNIPTQLQVGYKGEEYHAWISTYVDGQGWINGIIEFNGREWKLMDPTFASTSSSPKKFLSKDDDYLLKYVY